MFDGQTLTLLGIARFEIDEPKQLQQFLLDQKRMAERNPESVRLRRMVQTLQVLDACISIGIGKDKAKGKDIDRTLGKDKTEAELLAQAQAPTLEALALLTDAILEPDFDFEAACNLLSVLALLPTRNVNPPDAEQIVHKLGMRFATSMAMSELLMGAARKEPRFCELLTDCNTHVLQILEHALAPSRNGDARTAVETLLSQGLSSLNAKVIETAWRVLQRYKNDISNADELAAKIEPWRATLGTAYNKPVLGDRNMRQSGGVSLRGMDTAPLQPTMLAASADN